MFSNIGFIGLGLIGGSIARRIRAVFPDVRIAAVDRNKKGLALALSDHTIDSAAQDFEPGFFEGCDLIFICTPVLCVEEFLVPLRSVITGETILTDVGSVKGEILSLINKHGLTANFIGGHPMCGTEKSGYENSFSEMLTGANYVLAPSHDVSVHKVDALKEFISELGANPLIIEPLRHDFAAAAISHLPHILSYTLALLIGRAEGEDMIMHKMAAGGLRDMTRIASSSPRMWEQICLANKDNVLKLLDSYTKELEIIRKALEDNDGETLNKSFCEAKSFRDTL